MSKDTGAGKGSRPRPKGVDESTWADNYTRIFGTRKKKKTKDI